MTAGKTAFYTLFNYQIPLNSTPMQIIITGQEDDIRESIDKSFKEDTFSNIATNSTLIDFSFVPFIEQIKSFEEVLSLKYVDQTNAQANAIIQPIRTTPKIPRNSLCPCKRGLKYKHCCINK